ncbi:MAG: LamG-like jellyroll fold domain-containing protein [Bacteroidia bacterium]
MKNIYLTLAIIVLSVFCGFSQPTPLAYYTFSGNANDSGSNNIDGTVYGNPTITTDNSGTANSAYEFDGVDDYIDLGSSLILKPASQVSLALWAYSSDWTSFTSWAALAGNTASGGYELIINGSDGTLESEVRRNGDYGIASVALTTLSNGWHHFALTYDGRYNILYVDGIAVNTDDAGANYSIEYGYPNNSTIIGDEAGTGSTPEGDSYTGKIDEVRFYDVALSALEIQTLYNSSTGLNESILSKNHVTYYPNPALDKINITKLQGCNEYVITLTDISGKTVNKTSAKATNGLIIYKKPANVEAGFYLLTLTDVSGNTSSEKVVFK